MTDATPDDIRGLAADAPWARTVYAVGERFGTVGVVLSDGTVVEVSRYRPDAVDAAGTSARFAIDASHRDFTANALAFDLTDGTLLDPLGGVADLERRLLRAPAPEAERFVEDPLRVLRAGRFVAELDFELAPATAAAMPSAVERLAEVAPERVRDELTRLLVSPRSSHGLRALHAAGALAVVLPEVAALEGVTQPTFHDLDVFEHTLMSVDGAPATKVLRWAALLHDVGKAPTRTVEPDGRIRFFRHAQVGAQMTEAVCHRLRMSNDDTAAIVHLVAEHMRLGDVDFGSERSVDRAVRRLDLTAGAGEHVRTLASAEDAVALTVADFAATAHRDEAPRSRAHLTPRWLPRGSGRRASDRLPGVGHRAHRELGLEQGPQVGVAKRAIEEALEAGTLAADDRAAALRIAREALG